MSQKEIKRIEEAHFSILLSKLSEFREDLTLTDAFVAGLIAAFDYSIISMIFTKIIDK